MAALARDPWGHRVAPFKVGPDFIDPSYHSLATGRPGRNLDAFLSGPELVGPLFAHGSEGADVAIIEGVMGLFDGKSGGGEFASTAHVAKLLKAPVLLVIDAGAMARSAAAIVDRKSTRLNSSHANTSYAVFCLKKKRKRTRLNSCHST